MKYINLVIKLFVILLAVIAYTTDIMTGIPVMEKLINQRILLNSLPSSLIYTNIKIP